MKVKVTITAELDDATWGFSDLLEDLDGASQSEREAAVLELIREDTEDVPFCGVGKIEILEVEVQDKEEIDK